MLFFKFLQLKKTFVTSSFLEAKNVIEYDRIPDLIYLYAKVVNSSIIFHIMIKSTGTIIGKWLNHANNEKN